MQLPDGRPSILVDPGAWTNLCGMDTIRRMNDDARRAGYMSRQWEMDSPLQIMGVGEGTQACRYEARVPFAFQSADGAVTMNAYDAPIVGGSGSQLPALLGLRSIQAKNGVLETRAGHQCLTFPGPGGYTINWSPGTVHYPLVSAPSGHLVIPFADLSSVTPNTGGLPSSPTIFMANPSDDQQQEPQLRSTPEPGDGRATTSVVEEGAVPRDGNLPHNRSQEACPACRFHYPATSAEHTRVGGICRFSNDAAPSP